MRQKEEDINQNIVLSKELERGAESGINIIRKRHYIS